MTQSIQRIVFRLATDAGYTDAEKEAGLEFYRRKNRMIDPPGWFDKAGRFYANELTEAVLTCRAPSSAFPYPEMKAARTAAHCAEVFGVEPLAVRRIARAMEAVGDGRASGHDAMLAAFRVRGVLKPMKRAASAEGAV